MNITKSKIIGGIMTTVVIGALTVVPVFAQSTSSSTGKVKAALSASLKGPTQAERTAALGARGEKEIQVRVDSLNKLITRVQALRNVSDAQKASIVSSVQGLITTLNGLSSQISSEASSTALKSDIQEITQNYRVYALAMPQLNIFAAADRILTITSMMNAVGVKLQTRLGAATGVLNMTALQAAFTDFSAKIADAGTQAQNAVSEVSPLVPDQGDKTKMASNTTTLKDARTKIQAAQKDLVAARKDTQTIIQALVKSDKTIMNGNPAGKTTTSGGATASGTTTGTTTP